MKRVEKPTPFLGRKKCKCGHIMNFYVKHKLICKWCGRLVYYDEKEKFKEKMENILRKEKNDK